MVDALHTKHWQPSAPPRIDLYLPGLESLLIGNHRIIQIRRFKATPRHTEQCKQRVERLSLSGIEENGEQEEKMNYIPKYLAVWLDKTG